MAKSKSKSRRKAKPYFNPVDQGTDQTRVKFRRDTIDRLVESKKIGSAEMMAVEEISDIYNLLCRGLLFKSPRFDVHIHGGPPELPTRVLHAYSKRFQPWARALSTRRNTDQDKTLEIVYALVIDRMTAREVDRRNGFRKGTAAQFFIAGLRSYAAMGGWTDRNTIGRWQADAHAFYAMRGMSRKLSIVLFPGSPAITAV